jgi:hypothetical protein
LDQEFDQHEAEEYRILVVCSITLVETLNERTRSFFDLWNGLAMVVVPCGLFFPDR